MAGQKISKLRVDDVRYHRAEAIVAVTVISGRFDYGADQVSVVGKNVLVRSYCRVHVAGMQPPAERVISMEMVPGGMSIEIGDVIVLRFD